MATKNETESAQDPTPTQSRAKSRAGTRDAKVKGSAKSKKGRTRTTRPYPVAPFREALQLGDAIFKFAAGDKVRRLTLLEKLERNPNSSATKMLITNSGKYGITTGSYAAEFLELTPLGRAACDPANTPRAKLKASFELAVQNILPFKTLYDCYVGKKMPAHEILFDRLVDEGINLADPKECVELFVTNAEYLRLLRTIAGAETLVSIDQALEELGQETPADRVQLQTPDESTHHRSSSKWETTCFYITPIGDEESTARRHSDLFLSMLVEPALKPLGLDVIRADKIAEPGMITSHILEHLKRSRLVIADLSMLNPNVFYEMAVRHAVRLPIVQIIQKSDRLPFDVNQVNSLIIDNTDIYSFTPKLETYRSEIALLARRALEDPAHVGNPISVFYPEFWK